MKIRFVKPERADPSRDHGILVPYAPAKRQLARWRWYLILLVVSSPLLYFVSKMAYSAMVVVAPGVISVQQVALRTPGQGYVEEIYVKPFDEVKTGDALLRVSNRELVLQADKITEELHALTSIATHAPGGQLSSSIFNEQISAATRQKRLHADRLNKLQQLVVVGAATEGELSAARNDYQQALARIADLNQSMASQARPDSAGHAIQARVLALRTELSSINQQLEQMVVRAPTEGRVVDIAVAEGDQLATGGKVVMLAPEEGDLFIDTYLPPAHAEFAQVGQRATVMFPDGQRRQASIATVPEVAQQVPSAHEAFFGSRELGVLVRMQFDAPTSDQDQHNLSNGLPVEVRFHRQTGLRLPQSWALFTTDQEEGGATTARDPA